MQPVLIRFLGFVAALYCSAACAGEAGPVDLSVSAFGTFGVVHSSAEKADFTSSIYKPSGAGFTHEWSPDVDSLIGAQLTAKFGSHFSAVLQIVAEQTFDDDYDPHVEWANVKYQVTPDFSVRAGRIMLPAFLFSDSRKVGYSFPWVRLPIEVNRLVPISNSDGVDASYRLHFGNLANTFWASVGRNEVDMPANLGGGVSTSRKLWGISNTSEYGSLTVRIAYMHADLTVEAVNPLFAGFRQFGPQGVAIADKFDSVAKPYSFTGIGVSYEPGKWFAISEWGTIATHSFLGDRTAWYISGGVRLGEFTPYVIFAQAKADEISDPGLTVAALPPFLAGPATGLNAALNTLLNLARPVQDTIAVGGRWNFTSNAALKLQFDQINLGSGSGGTLTNLQPGFQHGGRLNVISVAVDLVF